MACAKGHFAFSSHRKEMESLTQEHKEMSSTLSQIASSRNTTTLDGRKCREVQRLLQTNSEYDSLIRDRKALLADLDNQVRAFPG